MSKRLAVVSLGCDKNRVDTENMLYYLSRGDYLVSDKIEDAEIIVVNTCAFIESARAEAVEIILDAAAMKKTGKCKKLIVTGCLPEKYRSELETDLPEVDAFLGVREYEKIRSVIEGGTADERTDGRILTTPPHYAYLRIADGCDNFCTYCTIPSIRGKYRSEPLDKLFSEAKRLSDFGVKELIVVAQDVTNYGKDIYGEPSLVKLVRELSTLDFTWIRLMYCYPELVTDELIEEIATNDKIAKYIDIPMQHVADSVLKRMNRRSNTAGLRALCEKLRRRGIALRTTFMVGFPGESEADFAELCEFVSTYAPKHIGIFAYSREDGTPSAKLSGQLSARIKRERVKILGEIHLDCVKKANAELIGKTLEVIYEDIDSERQLFRGRIESDAPEIDGNVYFSGDFADVGNFYKVKITGYDGYDLLGEIL